MTFNFFSFLYDVLYIYFVIGLDWRSYTYFVIGPDWRSRFEDPKFCKGIAHAQPFKLWTSCNLLALASSLWMHGYNLSRICSLGCIVYFKIWDLPIYVLRLWFLLDYGLVWQSLSAASLFSIDVAAVNGFYVGWEHSGTPKWIFKVINTCSRGCGFSQPKLNLTLLIFHMNKIHVAKPCKQLNS